MDKMDYSVKSNGYSPLQLPSIAKPGPALTIAGTLVLFSGAAVAIPALLKGRISSLTAALAGTAGVVGLLLCALIDRQKTSSYAQTTLIATQFNKLVDVFDQNQKESDIKLKEFENLKKLLGDLQKNNEQYVNKINESVQDLDRRVIVLCDSKSKLKENQLNELKEIRNGIKVLEEQAKGSMANQDQLKLWEESQGRSLKIISETIQDINERKPDKNFKK